MQLHTQVQTALVGLGYMADDFVCSGLWCEITSNAYAKFLIDQGADPHFARVAPLEARELPGELHELIYGEPPIELVVELSDTTDLQKLDLDLGDEQAEFGPAEFGPGFPIQDQHVEPSLVPVIDPASAIDLVPDQTNVQKEGE